MNRQIKRSLAPLLVGIVLLAAGCEKDPAAPDDTPSLESDRPNMVALTLVDAASGDTARALWKDLDGDGGSNPVVDTLKLTAGHSYNGIIEAFQKKSNPDTLLPFNATYRKFAGEHQFFYEAKEGVAGRIGFVITDRDDKGLPLGLTYTAAVTAGAPATGIINVVLGHFDEAPKDGTTRSPESDIDANFPVLIR